MLTSRLIVHPADDDILRHELFVLHVPDLVVQAMVDEHFQRAISALFDLRHPLHKSDSLLYL